MVVIGGYVTEFVFRGLLLGRLLQLRFDDLGFSARCPRWCMPGGNPKAYTTRLHGKSSCPATFWGLRCHRFRLEGKLGYTPPTCHDGNGRTAAVVAAAVSRKY